MKCSAGFNCGGIQKAARVSTCYDLELFTAVTSDKHWHKDIYSITHRSTLHSAYCCTTWGGLRSHSVPLSPLAALVGALKMFYYYQCGSYLFQYRHFLEWQELCISLKAMYHRAESLPQIRPALQRCLMLYSLIRHSLQLCCLIPLLSLPSCLVANMGFCYQKQQNMWEICALPASQLHRRTKFRVWKIFLPFFCSVHRLFWFRYPHVYGSCFQKAEGDIAPQTLCVYSVVWKLHRLHCFLLLPSSNLHGLGFTQHYQSYQKSSRMLVCYF